MVECFFCCCCYCFLLVLLLLLIVIIILNIVMVVLFCFVYLFIVYPFIIYPTSLRYLYYSLIVYDNVAEWSKACDSKSLLLRRRRFKSCRCRFLVVGYRLECIWYSSLVLFISFCINRSGYLFIDHLFFIYLFFFSN